MDPLGIRTAPVAGINIGVHLDPVGWKGLIIITTVAECRLCSLCLQACTYIYKHTQTHGQNQYYNVDYYLMCI